MTIMSIGHSNNLDFAPLPRRITKSSRSGVTTGALPGAKAWRWQTRRQSSRRQLAATPILFLLSLQLLIQLLLPYDAGHSWTAQAYSAGAGSCPRGVAAVGGSHLTGAEVVREGTLSEGSFQVTVGDVVLVAHEKTNSSSSSSNTSSSSSSASSEIPEFYTDTTYEISVLGTRYAYKGCLIRLESLSRNQDLYAALLPGTNMGPAFACFGDTLTVTVDEGENSTDGSSALMANLSATGLGNLNATSKSSAYPHAVTGISHTANPLKQLHSGVLRLSDPGEMVLDITVVGINNASASLYAYSEYYIRFVNPPTKAPVQAPAAATATVAPTTVETSTNATTQPAPTPTGTTTSTMSPFVSLSKIPTVPPQLDVNETITDSPIEVNASSLAPTASPTTTNRTQNAPTILPPGIFQVPSTPMSLLVETLLLVFSIDAVESGDNEAPTSSSNNRTGDSSNSSTTSLSPEQLETWINVTQEWFDDFYNRGFSDAELEASGAVNETTSSSTSTSTTSTKDATMNRQRLLQTLSNNYGVVPGSMKTTLLNVTIEEGDDNSTSTAGLALSYHQQLDYSVFNTSKLKKPFGPLQYTTLPFRSRKARSVYALRLSEAFADSMLGSLTADSLPVPQILGPNPSASASDTATTAATPVVDQTTKSDSDDGLSWGAIAGIVVAGLVVMLVAAALLVFYSQNDDRHVDPVTSLVPEFGRETFSFGPDGGAGANGGACLTDVEASSDEVQEKNKNGQENKEAAPRSPNEYIVYAPSGRLGIVLDSPDKEGPVVYVIKENSPLMEAIEVGDRLIAVDEVDVRQMTPTKVSKLISKRSSNPMRKLTLLRSKNPEITIVFEKDGKSPVSSKGGTSPV